MTIRHQRKKAEISDHLYSFVLLILLCITLGNKSIRNRNHINRRMKNTDEELKCFPGRPVSIMNSIVL